MFDINISKKDTEKWRRQYYSIDEALQNIELINIDKTKTLKRNGILKSLEVIPHEEQLMNRGHLF